LTFCAFLVKCFASHKKIAKRHILRRFCVFATQQKGSNSMSANAQTLSPAEAGFAAPQYAPNRWDGIARNYSPADVARLQGSVVVRHTLAEMGAKRLWQLLHSEDYVAALGAFTGNQAVQQARAGLRAIYLSGWQVAADANLAGQMYPDQSLYPANSVPAVVRRINQALIRADQIQTMERLDGKSDENMDWFLPIVADAEAGFGGALNAYELMKGMIEAGAAGVHFEDQLSSEKKCGHLGGKVLIPTSAMVRTLNAARLAADVCGVPALIVARTDADSARLITSDSDPQDKPFIKGAAADGFFRIGGGLEMCVARGLAYAPFADLLWMETSTPSLEQARSFAEAIHAQFPGKMLAYNCSPSFNWNKHMSANEQEAFQRELGALGFKFLFVTLAGFHSLNYATFRLARDYKNKGMLAYAELQRAEFDAMDEGFTAVKHQREVGVGYFDAIANAVAGGASTTAAMAESTETAQF
jgi:isocitrate lyase